MELSYGQGAYSQVEKQIIDETQTCAQLHQDIHVLNYLNNKKNGFYVEIGANDGIKISNTLLLEKDFGWTGILIEPDPSNFKKLVKNRPNSICVNKACFERKAKGLEFSIIPDDGGVLSGISECIESKYKSLITDKITVESDTLLNILIDYGAPKVIDFLSVDTEGSELCILRCKGLFKKYKFRMITIEHNFRPDRVIIRNLLVNNGYKYLGQNYHDDLYIHN